MNQPLKTNIQFLEQKVSEVLRKIDHVQQLVNDHAEALSEKEDPNEHKWGAFSENLDQFKEAISDLEGYGFNQVRNIN